MFPATSPGKGKCVSRKVILDCDPGHDDAIAIMLAHGSPEIELLAVTTVAGNQTLERVTANALAVATVCGMTGVPVAAGAAAPLQRPLRTASAIHGPTGLDGPTLPPPTVALDPRPAVDVIIETIMAHDPGTVTLVPVGPLTNIATALAREPRLAGRVAGVVLMGGSYTRGNSTPAAEFNIYVDPEAAAAVFGADWPVTMIGLDLTHQALATPDVIDRIAAVGTGAAGFAVDVLQFFASTYRRVEGFSAPPVHDPCAVAHVIDPAVMATRPARVDIELTGTHTLGMTVTDFASAEPNALVATDLDRAGFWDLVVEALRTIG
jgi:purine nucleosidase